MQHKITCEKSKLIVDTNGGKILELVLNGVKILGTYKRVDGKAGATHVCVPNFAGEGIDKFGLPFHGPARNMDWTLKDIGNVAEELHMVIEALEHYDSSIEITQVFIIGKDSFSQEVRVKNNGKDAVPVNIGIHNYFDTPKSWEEVTINNKSIKKEIENNLAIKIANLSDFHNNHEVKIVETQIVFPKDKKLLLHTKGASELVTWTGVKDGKYNKDFACIEPVCWFDPKFFGTPHSLLDPGETRVLKQDIILQE